MAAQARSAAKWRPKKYPANHPTTNFRSIAENALLFSEVSKQGQDFSPQNQNWVFFAPNCPRRNFGSFVTLDREPIGDSGSSRPGAGAQEMKNI